MCLDTTWRRGGGDAKPSSRKLCRDVAIVALRPLPAVVVRLPRKLSHSLLPLCVGVASHSSAWCIVYMVHTSLLLPSYVSLDILDPLRPSDGIKSKSQRTRRCWGALLAEHSGLRVHPTRAAQRCSGWLVALRRNLRGEPWHMPVFVVVSALERVVCLLVFKHRVEKQAKLTLYIVCMHIFVSGCRLDSYRSSSRPDDVRCRFTSIAAVNRRLEKPRRGRAEAANDY